jgi:hypothetical protein
MKLKTTCQVLVVAALSAFAPMMFAQHLDPNRSIPSVHHVTSTRAAPLFKQVRAGALHLTLETNTLADIEKAFGGTIQHEGDAGDSTYWLCYAGAGAGGKPALFWFVSGEMGGSDHGILNIAMQPNPTGKVPEGCTAAPHDLTNIDFGIPGVGAAIGDVASRFGDAKPDHDGLFHYAASYPSVEAKDFTVTQTLVYTAKNGRVAGVSITQVTSN